MSDDYYYIEPGPDPRVAAVMFWAEMAILVGMFCYAGWAYFHR